MKSFNRIALGLIAGSLLVSGCQSVDHWWKREHALMPLKEQYWNGELSYAEYRDRKQALIADMEATDYKTPAEYKQQLRDAIDNHHANKQKAAMDAKEDAAVILEQDNAMIQSTTMAPTTKAEVQGDARAMEDEMAPTNSEIDYGLLSRGIKKADSSTTPVAPVTPVAEPSRAMESAPVTSSGQEMITDSDQVKWTKDGDQVIYEDPKSDELAEQEIK